jgi:Mrp family chromosome partitioning ATPase
VDQDSGRVSPSHRQLTLLRHTDLRTHSFAQTMTGLSTERKIDDVQRRLLLDRLKPALSALYDDAEAAPSCLKDTRVDVLAHIEGWMADPSGKPVYWLTGVAGTGKTTIAQSVAMMADAKERRCLFGSFFFSRTQVQQIVAVPPP